MINQNIQVCIITEEASPIAKKSDFVIYFCEVNSAAEPIIIFSDLVEFSSTTEKYVQ
jgi:hypothetical protein